VIPFEIKNLDDLGLPPVCADLARFPRGFVVVTGPTGSGKSTTLAGMVDVVNTERAGHIMTVEDPIEFLHKHKACVVNQREIGADTHSFAAALKHVLRQDPDVILVGEMRDLETISTAITAAETGHLVFATLHTQDAPQTIDRIIDVFPPHQQQQTRVQLSTTLQGVNTQQLVPTTDGQGRVVAAEVMVATPGIRNLVREGKVHQIYSDAGRRPLRHADDGHVVGLARQGGSDQPADGLRALPRPRGAAAPHRVRRRPLGLLGRRLLHRRLGLRAGVGLRRLGRRQRRRVRS